MDLLAAVAQPKPLRLAPGQRALVPTGLVLELPPGFEAQVRPRSGLALRHGITVLNSPGTIDCDYRGEVMVLLANLGEAPFRIERGERIAQLVVQRVERAQLTEVAAIAATRRGAGGFGSTGVGGKAAGARKRRAAPQIGAILTPSNRKIASRRCELARSAKSRSSWRAAVVRPMPYAPELT